MLVMVPYGGSGGLAPWVRVREVKVPYGGSGGLAPWVRVRLVKVSYGGPGLAFDFQFLDF